MTADPAALVAFLRDAGVLGFLVLAVIGGHRGWFVWGWQYREIKRDRDLWQHLAIRATRTTEVAASVVDSEVARRVQVLEEQLGTHRDDGG